MDVILEYIRDQFIVGVRDPVVFERLSLANPLTLETALETARNAELSSSLRQRAAAYYPDGHRDYSKVKTEKEVRFETGIPGQPIIMAPNQSPQQWSGHYQPEYKQQLSYNQSLFNQDNTLRQMSAFGQTAHNQATPMRPTFMNSTINDSSFALVICHYRLKQVIARVNIHCIIPHKSTGRHQFAIHARK